MAALTLRNLTCLRISLPKYRALSTNSTNEEVEWLDYYPSKNREETDSDETIKPVASGVNGINDCPKSCLCSNNINIDYKNVRLLSQFVSSQTEICMTKQREIAKAIKRSRTMGFMPYTSKIHEYVNDPDLF